MDPISFASGSTVRRDCLRVEIWSEMRTGLHPETVHGARGGRAAIDNLQCGITTIRRAQNGSSKIPAP